MTIWTVYFLSAVFAYADGEVLIPAPDISAVEYRAYLQAHSELRTPSGALDARRPSRNARERLIRLFADAQAAYLSDDLEGARKSFETVVGEATTEDWGVPDREILILSFLRLAQMAPTPEQRLAYLKGSAVFGAADLDRKLFPPPLIQEWEETLKNVPMHEVRVAGLGRDWSRVLFNGQICTQNPCRIRADRTSVVRITWLSDRWLPVTKFTLIEQAERIEPDRRAWLAGRCEEPKWSEESEKFASRQAFFGLECTRATVARAARDLNFQPSAAAASPTWPEPPKKTDRPIYKSPWLWLGVGALAAIVVANNPKSKDKDKEPSTTYGY